MRKEDIVLTKLAKEFIELSFVVNTPNEIGVYTDKVRKRFPLEKFKAKHFNHGVYPLKALTNIPFLTRRSNIGQIYNI